MAAYFLDASALVKRYVAESGTAWVTDLLDPVVRNRLYVARITGAEVIAALTRKERGGHLSAADTAAAVSSFQHDYANRLRPVEITAALIVEAMAVARTQGYVVMTRCNLPARSSPTAAASRANSHR